VSDDTYCHGQYSYYANLKLQPSADIATLFPAAADGTPWPGRDTGETATSTLRQNAVEGLWLPVFIPAGCDGHTGTVDPRTGEVLPDVVLQNVTAAVPSRLDALGLAHSSPEVDQARYDEACAIGLESAQYTAGSPFVKDIG
jgi:hypothetical protein